ncbi:MAG: sigma-70 family RNA polymerase sigma factor [Clostridia bacterium]|nr:sigma-70 family RNA polymerase sigma factor [Clostridia bacterium]
MSICTETYNKEQVYEEYYPKVLQYVRSRSNLHIDAEDIAQTVFMKVFGKWDYFDPQKSSISTWIYNITRNTLIDYQRAMTFRQHGELSESLTDDYYDILNCLVSDEEQERLVDALKILSTDERDLIVLHYYSEYTLLYISELLHKPYGQVKRLHMKALKKIKRYMEEDECI